MLKTESVLLVIAILLSFTGTGCKSELITDADKTDTIVSEAIKEIESRPEPETPPPPKMSGDAFRLAAHDGKEDLVREGIESGIDVTATDAQGHNALHMAAYNGHSDIVRMLLKAGCDVDSRDGKAMTPLMHASSGDFADTVETLIEAGAGIDLVDNNEGYTALMTAAALGQKEVVEVLLKHGANKELVDDDGESAMRFATKAGHDDIIQLLQDE